MKTAVIRGMLVGLWLGSIGCSSTPAVRMGTVPEAAWRNAVLEGAFVASAQESPFAKDVRFSHAVLVSDWRRSFSETGRSDGQVLYAYVGGRAHDDERTCYYYLFVAHQEIGPNLLGPQISARRSAKPRRVPCDQSPLGKRRPLHPH